MPALDQRPLALGAASRHQQTGEVRYSIPFFFGVRADVKLACLPTCQSADNPARYPPMSFADYLAELEPKNYDLTKAKA